MKNKFIVFLTLILGLTLTLFLLVGCDNSTPPPSGDAEYKITNIPTDRELVVGGEVTLGYSVTPTTATVGVIDFTSSNEECATITSAGKLNAVAEGRSTIALTVDGNVEDSFVINVVSNEKKITSITIADVGDDITLTLNETILLTYDVEPINHTDAISWESDEQTVVSVDQDGLVTAISLGNATVTVKNADGSKSDTLSIRVVDAKSFTADFSNASYLPDTKRVEFKNGDDILAYTSSVDEQNRFLTIETYKGAKYVSLTNAYKNEYNTFAFVLNNQLYKGIEYTFAMNLQLTYGQSATGIALCYANDPANARIVTPSDANADYNVLATNTNGFNRVEFTFTCPQDMSSLFVVVCDFNGQNVMAINELSISLTKDFVSSTGTIINKYVEDFRFATIMSEGENAGALIDVDASGRQFFYAPKMHENSVNSLETENGVRYFVKTNTYTETFTPNQMISTFAIEQGKSYSVTVEYKTVNTHNGSFFIYYAPDMSSQIGEEIVNGGENITDSVNWTFTAQKSSDGILFSMNDFKGDNKLMVSKIIIEEIQTPAN